MKKSDMTYAKFVRKIAVYPRMKAWYVTYESNPKEAKKLDTQNYCILRMVYVDPTGLLKEKEIRAHVAKSQGIGERWVYRCQELDQAITTHAFRLDS
jgi:hypothetical protein